MSLKILLIEFVLCPILLTCISAAQAGAPSIHDTPRDYFDIAIVAPRPLAEAAQELSERFQTPICYLDPPLEYRCDLREVFPDSQTLVPSGGKLDIHYNSDLKIDFIIDQILRDHELKGNAGQFKVLKYGNVRFIAPSAFTLSSGHSTLHNSILNIHVPIDPEINNCYDALTAICDHLSEQTPYIVHYGDLPQAFKRIRYEPSDASVGQHLSNIIISCNLQLKHEGFSTSCIWLIYFQYPSTRGEAPAYYLNLAHVLRDPGIPSRCKLRVDALRPIEVGAKILQERFKTRITYEDLIYVFPYETVGPRGQLSPRGGMINMEWDPESDGLDNVIARLANCEIQPRRINQLFGLRSKDRNYHIYPVGNIDQRGNLVPYHSVLETTSTIIIPRSTGADAVSTYARDVSLTCGKKIVPSFGNEHVMSTISGQFLSSLSFTNTPARDAITTLVHTLGANLSWELLYDPAEDVFNVNIYQAWKDAPKQP